MFNFRKRRLLKNLNNTYCRICCAEGKGVGVFAIRDIPAGVDPFLGPRKRRWIRIHINQITHLGAEVRRMVEDFCVVREDGHVRIYEEGFNGLHIRWFVNHSHTPNIRTDDYALSFTTIRAIRAGEEICYDYGAWWNDSAPEESQ